MASGQHWIPLESNPDVLNKYIHNLGVPTDVQFYDVFGLDPELLGMIPRPVFAVVLLFPITEKSKSTPLGEVKEDASNVFFVKQTISNACGTVAIVHALGNNKDNIKFDGDKHFAKFLIDTSGLSPSERASYLQDDKDMGAAHEDIAQEGQTQAPAADEKINTHFVTFVCVNNKLYELNGSMAGPICHGDTQPETFLEDTAMVAKKFMERDPTEMNFTLMALAKAE